MKIDSEGVCKVCGMCVVRIADDADCAEERGEAGFWVDVFSSVEATSWSRCSIVSRPRGRSDRGGEGSICLNRGGRGFLSFRFLYPLHKININPLKARTGHQKHIHVFRFIRVIRNSDNPPVRFPF